jgi:myosin-6
MEGGGSQKVWVTDPVHGFILGSIVDLNPEGVTVEPVTKQRNAKPLTVPYDRVYPAEDDDNKDVDDNCE